MIRFLTYTYLLTALIWTLEGQSQTSMLLEGEVFVVLDDGAKLTLGDSSPDALIEANGGGNIVSEDEFDMLVWPIGENRGDYRIPFITTPISQGGTGVEIPFEMTVGTGAEGRGAIRFSTHETFTDMNMPYPSGVYNMNGNGSDVSRQVIDRFWTTEATGYIARPSTELVFFYDDSPNEMGGGNTISESELRAQRWDIANSTWHDQLYGNVNPGQNRVRNVQVPSADFSRSWVLSSNSNPLPIELLAFDMQCRPSGFSFSWTTASEINNSHFIVEQSVDGNRWQELFQHAGAGNSSSQLRYDHWVEHVGDGTYYRLTQVDFDGTSETFDAINRSCLGWNAHELNMTLYPNPSNGHFEIQIDQEFDGEVLIYDAAGRTVQFMPITGQHMELILNVSPGAYTLVLESAHQRLRKRFTVY